MSNFQIRLKKLREEKQLSQYKLAELLKMPQSNIGMYESGKRMPPPDILEKFADFFSVSVDYLLGRTDTPAQSTPQDLNIAFRQAKGLSDDDKKDLSRIINKMSIPDNLKDVPVAFHTGVDGLTQEDIDNVSNYIEFLKSKKKK